MENLDVGDDDGDVILKRNHTFSFKPIVGSRAVLSGCCTKRRLLLKILLFMPSFSYVTT